MEGRNLIGNRVTGATKGDSAATLRSDSLNPNSTEDVSTVLQSNKTWVNLAFPSSGSVPCGLPIYHGETFRDDRSGELLTYTADTEVPMGIRLPQNSYLWESQQV